MADTAARANWVSLLQKIARPMLDALAEHRLRRDMPVESRGSNREDVSHLEAVGRLLAGISPWLALETVPADEVDLHRDFNAKVRFALDSITHADSPDRLNFTKGGQPLVDAAFLAHALIRAPRLFETLAESARGRLLDAFESTRVITPGPSNWLLFSAMIEAALCKFGRRWDRMRVDYAVRQHLQWYKGDGVYGDGASLHVDYYNSFVIQPMLLDVVETTRHLFEEHHAKIHARAVRFAAILERSISPEGAIPVVGRSIAYRMGSLQMLSQMALRNELPDGVSPAAARCAIWAATSRFMNAPGTFDDRGWLRIGFCGAQPSAGEGYISTGSLYLCSVALLPLGLPADAPFWRDPPERWTSAKAYAGEAFPIDHAIAD